MKSNSCKASLAVAILIAIRSSTFGQGFIPVIQHSGNADPTTEEFTLSSIGYQASIGPVTNNGYHNYEIVYRAATDTAALWVDGTEEASDFLSDLSSAGGIAGIHWGETQSGPSGANWSLVSLEAIPEPSVFSLIFLGSGVLLFGRSRRRFWSCK